MIDHVLEHCPSFISSQTQLVERLKSPAQKSVRRAVTMSRQAGCGALVVAEKLADYLQAHSAGNACPWMVFDRNLMDKVLEDHNLPPCLAKFLPEDRISELEDIMAEVFGVHPPSTTVIQSLKLDEEHSAKFIARYNKHQDTMHGFEKERNELVDKLDTQSKSDAGDDDYSRTFNLLLDVDKKISGERLRFLTELKEVLSNKQIAEYIVFERNFVQELRQAVATCSVNG